MIFLAIILHFTFLKLHETKRKGNSELCVCGGCRSVFASGSQVWLFVSKLKMTILVKLMCFVYFWCCFRVLLLSMWFSIWDHKSMITHQRIRMSHFQWDQISPSSSLNCLQAHRTSPHATKSQCPQVRIRSWKWRNFFNF